MSDAVSWGTPLAHPNGTATESGIALPPPPADVGHPIVTLQTTIPGLVYNVAGPEQRDLEQITNAVVREQRKQAEGRPVVTLWFRDPQFGEDVALTDVGLAAVTSVCRAFAAIVAHSATGAGMRPHRGKLHLPER